MTEILTPQPAERNPMVPLSAMRAIAVEAIRAVTGCPDIKGNDGRHLVDELESVARAAAEAIQAPEGGPADFAEYWHARWEETGALRDEYLRTTVQDIAREAFEAGAALAAQPAITSESGSAATAQASAITHESAQTQAASETRKPYAITNHAREIDYIGMHTSEDDCWRTFLGWPTAGEVRDAMHRGFACHPVIVTKEPTNDR